VFVVPQEGNPKDLATHTVDGRTPAPHDMLNIALFTGFSILRHFFNQVQDVFHQSNDWSVC